MTMQLELPPELETWIGDRSRERGVSPEEYVREVLEREAGEPSARTQGEEKAAAFRAWVDAFPKDLPVLSLEAVSRDSMYAHDEDPAWHS